MLATPPPPPSVVILAGAELWPNEGGLKAQALAIRGTKIAAIGSAKALAQRFPKAQVVNLAGGTLLPGFIEGHCHVESLGKLAFYVDLGNVPTLGKALEVVKAWSASNREGWIQGRGWDQNLWPGQTFPSAQDLDAVTGTRPAALRRVDGHALWANSAALAAAGITSTTTDPKGGQILRDGKGTPTGILLDNAMDLVDKALPHPTLAQREAWVGQGLLALQRLGFTSACDMGGDASTLAIYRKLAAAKALPIRVFSYFDYDAKLVLTELRQPRIHQLSHFQVQGVKFYFDGALGSRGARMLAPYADVPATSGLWVTDPETLAQHASLVLRAGYQPAAHAIGDAANHAAVDLLGKIQRKGDALAPRVEHAQIVSPEDAAAFGKAGLVASVQPMHMADDHGWTPTRLGADRLERAFPWRTFLKGGAKLVFGSDAPIADANPFLALAAAETRQDAAGDPPGGFRPEQRLTRTEGLRAYTEATAEVLGHRDMGTLKVGAVADLLWIQAPVLDLKPEALRQLRPGRMWVNGAEVMLK
ncbi:MAG: amidohydrolase [Holophaga sp.]